MKPLWTGAQLCASLAAITAGWASAVIVTLPMELQKVYASATGSLPRRFGMGVFIWSAWALLIAVGGWFCGGLPLIALVRERWLLRHRRLTVLLAAAIAWTIVLIKFKVWKLLLPDQSIGARIFTLYSLLLVVFAVVTTAVYLRLRAQAIAEDEAMPPG